MSSAPFIRFTDVTKVFPRPDGKGTEAVLRGLPGNADHWVNHLVFDRRGALHFGVGSRCLQLIYCSQKEGQIREVGLSYVVKWAHKPFSLGLHHSVAVLPDGSRSHN